MEKSGRGGKLPPDGSNIPNFAFHLVKIFVQCVGQKGEIYAKESPA